MAKPIRSGDRVALTFAFLMSSAVASRDRCDQAQRRGVVLRVHARWLATVWWGDDDPNYTTINVANLCRPGSVAFGEQPANAGNNPRGIL